MPHDMLEPNNRRIAAGGWVTVLAAFLACMAAGCVDTKIYTGRLPDTGALGKSLKLGESTRADVQEILGYPFGEGRELLPLGNKPRTLWSYYYEEGNLRDTRRIFLFVFFDKDLYDGYMWFSSLKDIADTPAPPPSQQKEESGKSP